MNAGTTRQRGAGRGALGHARQTRLAAALLLSLALAPGVAAAQGLRGPTPGSTPGPLLGGPQAVAPAPQGVADASAWGGVSLAQGLLSVYRNVVSPVDGDRCDMAPSCSLYSRQALRRHGVLLGVLLTADRLLHEADEQVRVAPVRIGGELAYPDPLEHNTYWLPGWLGGPTVPPAAEGVDPGAAPTAPSDQARAELPRAGARVVPERAGE